MGALVSAGGREGVADEADDEAAETAVDEAADGIEGVASGTEPRSHGFGGDTMSAMSSVMRW